MIEVEKALCKGCKLCVLYCPPKCIELSSEINKRGFHYAQLVNAESCTACKICAWFCPDRAITVYKEV